MMAAHGERFWPAEHEGFVAGDWDGLITDRIDGGRGEVTLIDAVREGAVDRARAELKPTIPTHDPDTELPIRDEIEMALSSE